MKGLDWFKVVSNIAFDDDLEHVTDAAFRTYIELIGISSFRLSDGVVSLSDARKQCNSPGLKEALQELQDNEYIAVTEDKLVISSYGKHNPFRAEVEEARDKARERVRRYRSVGNAEVTEQSRVEKSREEKNIKAIKVATEQAEPVDKSPKEADILAVLYSIPGFPVDEKRVGSQIG
jgi:hypothetical protein